MMKRKYLMSVKHDQAAFYYSFVPAGDQRPAVQNSSFNSQTDIENKNEQTLSTTLRLPVFIILRITPPARLATATDEDTRRIKNELPAAMIVRRIKWGHVSSSHQKRCVTSRKASRVRSARNF